MKHKQFRSGASLGAMSIGLAMAPVIHAQSTYHITQSVSLGAPDRWDYVVVDGKSHHVFVSHADRVTVVDGRSGAVLGQIEGFPGGTHGIAIAAAAGRGYTDDGRAGTASSFDLSTFKTGKSLKADDDADAMAFDPVSGHVFVVDGDPGKLTVIDPKADAVIATIDAGGKLEYAVAGDNGKLYVNGEEKHEIVRIDTKRNQADAHWPMTSCLSPHGLAIDTHTHRLFSSCANSVMVVVDTDSGATVATLPIGRGTDAAAFDPKRKRAFSSNGQDGTLTVIQEKDANTFVVLDTIKTAVTGRTMGIDPSSGRLFVAAADIDANATTAPPSSAAQPGAPPTVAAAGRPRRGPPIAPGSLKLLFLDAVP